MAAQVLKHYRVGYKFPQQKSVNMGYDAPDLSALMRVLQVSEGVNTTTVESLFIHQILEGGKTLEVMAVERSAKEIKPKLSIVGTMAKPIITGEYDDDDFLLGWEGFPSQDSVINEVQELLERAGTPAKIPKHIKGFHFTAKPARSTTTEV